MAIVSASILTADFVNMQGELDALTAAGLDMLHMDVMDGLFVPNISFGAPLIKSVRAHCDLPMDVHLMIDRPDRYIENFAKVSDWLGFHYEAGSPVVETLERIRELGCKPYITIKPATPAEAVFDVLPYCDMVLVMSVEPGFGGQKFMPPALGKMFALKAEIKRRGLDVKISVDGGINGETAQSAVDAGADVLVAGSYLFGNPKMIENFEYLHSIQAETK